MVLCTQYSGHDIIIETETGLVVTRDWVWEEEEMGAVIKG